MRTRLGLITSLLMQGCEPAQVVVRLALRKLLVDCNSVLDAGCGCTWNMRWIGAPNTTGLEGYEPSYQKAMEMKTHDKLVKGDVREMDSLFGEGQFDACVSLDVIEHLTKEEGLKLLKSMERVARKRVIIFTPSGFLSQRHTERGDLQEHISGWEASEMRAMGYEVMGMLGPKSLRGEYHVLKNRPKLFWGVVSMLGHCFWTRWKPEKAAAILCVKNKQ